MKRLIPFALLLACASAYATTTGTTSNEVIVDFTDDSLPVLNQSLRKIQADIKTVQAAIPTTPSTVAATQADMEATTSTTTYASPARMQFSQSSAKAWCMFDGTTTGTHAPTVGYNVSSVTRNAAGTYTINFTYPFSSANYCWVATARDSAGLANLMMLVDSATDPTASALKIYSTNSTTGGKTDAPLVSVVCYGDQP